MDKESHEENNNHITCGDLLAKRKRGRPRKHVKPDDSNHHSPPGFTRSQQHQQQSLHVEAMVGQHVTGLIEATFEDGFLLSVKLGDSDTILRGVVFKPGHCTPLSVDNDVAPHVPMIRRNSHEGGRKSRFREKHGARALAPVPIQPKPLLPPVVQNGSGVHHGHMQTELQVSGASNGEPFETLLTQVMEKGQVHTESEEQALSIEPLQAIHPVHPVHMPKPMPSSYGRGNMTELLQENVRETHFPQGQ